MMSFNESINRCFSKYVTFSGRASRAEYWWWFLFQAIISITASAIDGKVLFDMVTDINVRLAQIGLCSLFTSAALFLPNLAVIIRRLHDTNHSGWWVLCPIVPLVMMFIPGDDFTNDYGDEENA